MKHSNNAILVACLCGLLGAASGQICTGPAASPNWYGGQGYPPFFTRDTPEKCPQKYGLTRCDQSAVMKDGTSAFQTDGTGAEICTNNVDCWPSKMNCNDTLVCSDLVNLKDELSNGGHNIICRHEKTYWQQLIGETQNCHLNANCMDPQVKVTQRQLKPEGWDSANAFTTAFREMGIPIGKTFSSPFTRCADHAELFSDDTNEERLELLYMGGWKEVLTSYNISQLVAGNALKWQAYNLRNFAGVKPMAGKNNIMVSHGFNIKLAFGSAIDEGYCMVMKPDDTLPSLGASIGNFTVANKVFEFGDDSYPVHHIARMSPESAAHMQTCDDVRVDLENNQDDDVLALYDSNHDMKITKDEFKSAHGDNTNSDDAFDFIQSVFIDAADDLGKPDGGSAPSIELGRFFQLNWGWQEFLKSGGNIFYPWRVVLENTIGSGGSTAEKRVSAFKKSNFVLSKLITALKDEDKYPSKSEMEKKLINCDSDDEDSDYVAQCLSNAFYVADSVEGSSDYSGDAEEIFGTPLAYPSKWKPEDGVYNNKSLKVASCLVTHGSLTHSEIKDAMGCDTFVSKSVSSGSSGSSAVEKSSGKTATALAWVFGVLFTCSVLGLVYVFAVLLPAKLQSSITNKSESA